MPEIIETALEKVLKMRDEIVSKTTNILKDVPSNVQDMRDYEGIEALVVIVSQLKDAMPVIDLQSVGTKIVGQDDISDAWCELRANVATLTAALRTLGEKYRELRGETLGVSGRHIMAKCEELADELGIQIGEAWFWKPDTPKQDKEDSDDGDSK